MRSISQRSAGVAGLAMLAAIAVGCGNGDSEDGNNGDGDVGSEEATTASGEVLTGETQLGMRLEAEPFADPDSDPDLARLDAYREAAGAPEVDYVRVSADNADGVQSDLAPQLSFSADASTLAQGASIQTRYTCEALQFEWPPVAPEAEEENAALLDELCADGPPQAKVKPGETQVYYLFTDRGFDTRGIEEMRLFGPLGAELVSQ